MRGTLSETQRYLNSNVPECSDHRTDLGSDNEDADLLPDLSLRSLYSGLIQRLCRYSLFHYREIEPDSNENVFRETLLKPKNGRARGLRW
jgi:hypothetical protein